MKRQLLPVAFICISMQVNAQWQLNGNAGTNPLANFVGTTDSVSLNFRVNSTRSGIIDLVNLNTAIGYQSGSNLSTGTNNTFFGAKAGISNSTGMANTYIGHQAGNNSTNGIGNTCVGSSAGALLLGGQANTVLGSAAGAGNLNGVGNTYLGYATGSSDNLANATAIGYNTSVSASNSIVLGNGCNVGIGISAPLDKLHVIGNIRMVDGNQAAGKILTSDANGTATWQAIPAESNDWKLGGNTGTNPATNFIGTKDNAPLSFRVRDTLAGHISEGLNCVFFGYKAGLANNGNFGNTFIGDQAGVSNVTNNNTFVGFKAGTVNTTGVQSVYIGTFSGLTNTTGSQNAYLGFNSGKVSNGSSNTFLGESAAIAHTSGNSNVMVGKSAASGLTTGNDNVIIGSFAASSLTSGSFNTVIGEGTSVGSSRTNGIAIGNSASVTLDNCAVIGNQFVAKLGIGKTPGAANIMEFSITTAKLTGGGVWTNASDRKLKDHITQLDKKEILEKINHLEVARWHYKADQEMLTHIGPFAKEFYASFKTGDDSTISTIDPSGVALIGIQQLSIENQELRNQITALRNELSEIRKMLATNDSEKSIPVMLYDESSESMLSNAIPNPANTLVTIKYKIAQPSSKGTIVITNGSGVVIKTIELQVNESEIVLNVQSLKPGIYSYSLIVDGVRINTKQFSVM